MANMNLNLTYSPGVIVSAQDFHTANLLKNMRDELLHYRDLQKTKLPAHHGRSVQFRRALPFGAVTEPLKEGVTPDGNTLVMEDVWGTVKSYGDYVTMTDEMNWALIDDPHYVLNEELSAQAALTLDTAARDPQHAGLNVMYGGGKSTRAAVTSADILTYDIIKRAVLALKRNKARKYPDGTYHAIVGPDSVHDLTADPMWVDVATYQDKQRVEKYELGRIYGVTFYETTNAKVFRAQSSIVYDIATLTATAWDAETRTLTLAEEVDEDTARALAGKSVNLDTYTVTIESATAYKNASNPAKIKLRWPPSASYSITGTASITPAGGGAGGMPVQSTIIFGMNHAGAVELNAQGGNIRTIIKPLGSSGVDDPLDQRQSIGWRIGAFCTLILQDLFIVRVEHGASQVSA